MHTIRALYITSVLLPDLILAAVPSALRVPAQSIVTTDTIPSLNRIKVPGESPAYHCANPSDDLFNVSRLDFIPTNPRMYVQCPFSSSHIRLILIPIRNSFFSSLIVQSISGYYLTTRFIGKFISSTGDVPWLNITGSINGHPEREPLYYSPLCDIDVFQEIIVQSPAGDYHKKPSFHRSCPPSIQGGYAVVSSPPVPLTPQTVPEGRYQVRAEAMTQDGRRIFCVEGSFDVTT
ncbi:MAG: hypothetical protein Q9181_006753 [Wetmoreana brouardii]